MKRFVASGMKWILMALWILSVIICVRLATAQKTGDAELESSIYPTTYIVTNCEGNVKDGFVLSMETPTGIEYAIDVEDGDWMVGDMVAAIVDDNGTTSIMDDKILDIRYAG